MAAAMPSTTSADAAAVSSIYARFPLPAVLAGLSLSPSALNPRGDLRGRSLWGYRRPEKREPASERALNFGSDLLCRAATGLFFSGGRFDRFEDADALRCCLPS
ncbi:hypothetical protein MTO96_022085 [Rhipicephalus appendiculatus]